MINRLIPLLFLCAAIVFTGCKDNSARISGTLLNHASGEYIRLDELKSDRLVPADSVKVSNNGTFALRVNPEFPSFYLLKLNNNNFLTMLVEPGEKILINAHHDSLNYPSKLKVLKGLCQWPDTIVNSGGQ